MAKHILESEYWNMEDLSDLSDDDYEYNSDDFPSDEEETPSFADKRRSFKSFMKEMKALNESEIPNPEEQMKNDFEHFKKMVLNAEAENESFKSFMREMKVLHAESEEQMKNELEDIKTMTFEAEAEACGAEVHETAVLKKEDIKRDFNLLKELEAFNVSEFEKNNDHDLVNAISAAEEESEKLLTVAKDLIVRTVYNK